MNNLEYRSCGSVTSFEKMSFKGILARVFAETAKLLKNPRKLLPTFVLMAVWILLSLMSGFGANIPVLRFIYTITYSNGGLYGGFLGALGGIFGKAVFVASVNALVLSIVLKQNIFKGVVKGIKSVTLDGIAPFIAGGGVGVLLYWFFNVTSAPINSAIAVVGALAAIKAAGSQNGILFAIVFFTVRKISKGKVPTRKFITHLLTGISAGFAISFPITFARYPILIFALGIILLAAGFALKHFSARKAAAVLAIAFVVAAPFCSFADALHEDEVYNGRLTYTNGHYNKYGQPFPDLMDFDRSGAIDYMDMVIQHELVHNPDYLDQPGNPVVLVIVVGLTAILGGGGGVAGAVFAGIVDVAESAAASGVDGALGNALGSSSGGADSPVDDGIWDRFISRDESGDLRVNDPVTGEEKIYVANGDGSYTNPITGATYDENELVSSIESRLENAGLLRQDYENSKVAIGEQRAANAGESDYAKAARVEKAEEAARMKREEEQSRVVMETGRKHGVYTGDIKDVKKAIISDQMKADQEGAAASGIADYADAGVNTAESFEKFSDKTLDILEKLDTTGAGKVVKDGYVAGKAIASNAAEFVLGEKSFSGAVLSAGTKVAVELTKNHAEDIVGEGAAGAALEGTANVTGDGVAAVVDSLARGDSLEEAREKGSEAAMAGAINFGVDKAVGAVGEKIGAKIIGGDEAAEEVVGTVFGAKITKDAIAEAATTAASNEIKEEFS